MSILFFNPYNKEWDLIQAPSSVYMFLFQWKQNNNKKKQNKTTTDYEIWAVQIWYTHSSLS